VAADLGSLGHAAVRLRVSQPSLSKRLASLEAKVGARLLERSARGVALTPAGRQLYRHARPLPEAADHIRIWLR
jgi:DNA-binding transcriptional LysR family regulator